MDEQDASQLNTDDKVCSDLILHETESEKTTCEDNSVSQLDSVMYTDQGTENEVITIVTEETDEEVYIYDGNDIENVPAENSEEYIQVCDSNNTFEEVNNSEEKDINIDVIDVEEENVKKEELKDASEVINLELEMAKEENAPGKESQPKNFKNIILEDWEVEVPHLIENHESENFTETDSVREKTQEMIPYNSENCAIVVLSEPEESVANQQEKDDNSDFQNEQTLKKNLTEVPKEISEEQKVQVLQSNNIKEESSILKQNFEQENYVNNQNENSLYSHNENADVKDVITTQLVEKKFEPLRCPKLVTKEEIVKILDDSSERVIRPIVGGKDLFFSIELTKRLNQKLSLSKEKTSETGEKNHESDSCNNNNTVDDRQKLVEILEADDIKDWKSTPSKSTSNPKENGNDMEISKAIKSMEEADLKVKTTTKPPRKTPLKKLRTMDKELERTLALQQLREEFPSTRKRSRTTKKVNHVPFLASTVLEKAMTSPEVTTALKLKHPRRRPCYLPDNVAYSKSKENTETVKIKNNESVEQISANEAKSSSELVESNLELPANSIPNPVVKTYSVKKKSTDTESDIKTTLEAVAKALNERSEDVGEFKPKKQKTVTKENKNKKILIKKKRKLKPAVKTDKKMNSELEKLLGDEGAVRMLYDTQHSETTSAAPKKSKFKTTTGLKKELVMKTKLVKNAVMRLSGVGTDGIFLRGKRRSICHSAAAATQDEKPLFSSTPNIVLYKPKKKQRAEASRILYRHSSSESFDSSEGYRRTSFDSEGLNLVTNINAEVEESKPFVVVREETPLRGRPRKSEILKKRLQKLNEARQRKIVKSKGNLERLSLDSIPASGSKLNLSNVPVRKSSRPRVISKKYSIWSSTSMDSLSVESLGLKKLKKASTDLAKKLNCKELTILQYEHLVQIVLTPSSTVMKNSLNCEVLKELVSVFNCLSEEESCRVVLLSSRGSTFCQGIDINGIISFNESEKKKGVSQLIKAIREFILCLTKFEKLVIAGVQGAAIGLGVTFLPYCDLVISSDTASFYTPYVKLGQAPEGAPILTFPLYNRQLVSELLFKSHKMTAADALKFGLVTQIIPEERFEEDLIMISRNMASQPLQGMQSIKFLLKTSQQRNVAEVLQAEGQLLEEHWNSVECLNNMIKFLNSGELQLKQNVNG